ncbi:hypothetical protein GSI_11736 [Ganoderma sinense ZZ0214-1]|uniref:Endonuclease/exonuclease/phosphatase domain-containing protein n=1 Tax=Ganoderma sinense ZZ0214-1 TaxID=1077348 RepID=A0A2G8RWU2_9APHY|nr:hypothetical protein GSI_11736 [Ganoderma sinense ZZ0214-1]
MAMEVQVPVDPLLQGRILVVDLIRPDFWRPVGISIASLLVYAPWDPGIPALVHDFWACVSALCASAPHSWALLGDCNLTLSSSESLARAEPNHLKRDAYLACLHAADGYDVWQTQLDADARTSYTCRSYTGHGQSIIDRLAVSRRGTLTATCLVPRDFIPATDHRPVLARIALSVPTHLAGHSPHLASSYSPPPYPPRFRYPKKTDTAKFQAFAQRVDDAVAGERLADQPVTDDASFTRRYLALTRILRSCGADTFDLPQTPPPRPQRPTTPHIRAILLEIHHINQLIAALRQGYLQRLVGRHAWVTPYLRGFQAQPGAPPSWHPDHSSLCLSYLTSLRRTLQRLRYRAERSELERRATRSSRARVDAVLMGGLEQAPLCPDGIKAQTINYFTELFRRAPRAPSLKPWLDTPSVRSIRSRVADHPFSWPQILTLQDLRFLLRKGNPRPAPGPDLWEKWCVRTLSDSSLSLVLDLVNYDITTSTFPECVKPTLLSTIFKRGPRTDLTNYRGITCSNLLKNLPFAWLNHLLSPYLTAQQILPQTQIATQPGVQARDLTSFLSQVEVFSHRHKRPLYLLAP